MPVQDKFEGPIAYNPAGGTDGAGALVPSAEFQVFDVADSSFSTPLAVFDPATGVTINPLRSSAVGVLPDFQVAGARREVLVRSGSFVTRLTSKYGVVFEAGLDPETVQAAIAAGTAAETARAAAVLAKTDAEAAAAEVADVVATNDGIMKAVAENPESAFSIELSRTMGAEAADPDSPLGTELRATFAPPVGMLVQMLGIIRARKRGYRLMVIGDSTSWYSTPSSWLRRLPTALAALFPWLTIELRIWDDATAPGSYTSVQTINGTTSQKLMIYGYVRSSMTFDYFADDARRSVAFPVAMDGVWVALGHNENNPGMASESGFGITALRAFSKAALHLELYRAYAGNAPMLVMSQNAITTNAGAPEQWAAIYQRICADRGYGFLDVAAAFNADPRGVAALLLGDGLHPNADGHQLWLAVVVGALAASSSAASQIIASATPTITLPGLSGIAWVPPSSTTPAGSGLNNLLQSRDNTTKLPAGWVGTNVTVTETTDIIGETGHRCLKLVKTDPAQPARIEQYLNYAALRGKTITAGFRIHVPSGQGNTVGVAELQGDDGTGTSISYTSPAWGQFDQWFWRTAMLRLPNGTNMIRRRIWLDQAGTDTDATLYLDRASLAIGGYPYEAA